MRSLEDHESIDHEIHASARYDPYKAWHLWINMRECRDKLEGDNIVQHRTKRTSRNKPEELLEDRVKYQLF